MNAATRKKRGRASITMETIIKKRRDWYGR